MKSCDEKISADRKYVAVSIKHSPHRRWFGRPLVLWGYHTADSEKRCFSDYTIFLDEAERYAVNDFAEHWYDAEVVRRKPVETITINFMRDYTFYDTVLVSAESYRAYCQMCEIPTQRSRALDEE